MSYIQIAFTVLAVVVIVVLALMLRLAIRENAMVIRQYDEMFALATMNAWALDRAAQRMREALRWMRRVRYNNAEATLAVARGECDAIVLQDPVTWIAVPFSEVVAPDERL